MVRRIATLAVVWALAGCGSDSDSPAPAPPQSAAPLDPRFSGTWTGTTTVTSPGLSPVSYASALVVAAAGQTATVSEVCPGGGGSVTAQGSSDTARWSGRLTCAPVAFGGCGAVAVTFTEASLSLTASGTLNASGSGTADGCGISLPVTFSFAGTK